MHSLNVMQLTFFKGKSIFLHTQSTQTSSDNVVISGLIIADGYPLCGVEETVQLVTIHMRRGNEGVTHKPGESSILALCLLNVSLTVGSFQIAIMSSRHDAIISVIPLSVSFIFLCDPGPIAGRAVRMVRNLSNADFHPFDEFIENSWHALLPE
jgi:hypothetical protein